MGAALAAIALAVSLKARTEVERTTSAIEATRARFLAAGAAERALNYIIYGLNGSPRWPDGRVRFWEPGMPLLRLRFKTGEAVVEMIPESSRINVNEASPQDLTRLNLAMGMPQQAALQLAQAIIDWRAPSPMGLFSPFDAIYLQRNPSFRAPHASVLQIDELMNVAGMTSELFFGGWTRTQDGRLAARAGLRDCLTVFADADSNGYDINTTAVPMMVALGAPLQGALAVEQLRSRMPISRASTASGFRIARPGGRPLPAGRRQHLYDSRNRAALRSRRQALRCTPYSGHDGATLLSGGLRRDPCDGLAGERSTTAGHRRMVPMIPEWLRPLFRFGTGAGIVVGAKDLTIYLARLRPNGPKLLATLTISDFRQRQASEWGAEYQRLLDKHKTGPLPALAVLPRERVLLRVVSLPGVTDEDSDAAIRFQLDALHPYQDEEIVHDWQRIGHTSFFAVAIAEKRHIDEYVAMFAEAGVVLAGMTLSASTLFSSMRIYGEPPTSGVLAVGAFEGGDASSEVYGESPAKPLFSALLQVEPERAAALAASELRLEPGVEPRAMADLLPAWTAAPEDFDFSDEGRQRAAQPWAAALASAQPRLSHTLNLLPVELRFVSSRLLWVPSAVLAGLLAITLAGWFFMTQWTEKGYLAELERRIARVTPQAQKIEAIDKEVASAVDRIQMLDQYRKRTRADLDLVLDVTQSFPPPAFLNLLSFDRTIVAIGGEIADTDGLLKKLDGSPRLAGSEFSMPLTRIGANELFRIRARREGGPR